MNKEEISKLSKSLAEKSKEAESLLKDRDFLKYRVERLENHFYEKEKQAARGEVEKILDQESRIKQLIKENDRLKEDVLGSGRLISPGEVQQRPVQRARGTQRPASADREAAGGLR